jgi:hypothetical protein
MRSAASKVGTVAVPGKDLANHEVDHHSADVRKEFADLHRLARLVGLLDNGVLAVGLERRTGRGPHEVRSTNPGVPEFA